MRKAYLREERNQSMEICKLVASIFVVFIHVRFPGILGGIMDCLARFAVPAFFVISGFFNYQAGNTDVRRRLLHILKLNLASITFYIVWYSIVSLYYNGTITTYLSSVFTIEKFAKWIILNSCPFSDHLWYLTAIGFCYLIFWIYTSFWPEKKANYLPLYIMGAVSLLVTLFCDALLPAVNIYVPCELYRNAWLFGLSMFIFGVFLREYHQKIITIFQLNAAKLIFLVAGGILFSMLQWKGSGALELPVGSILEVFALMLLFTMYPKVPASSPMVNLFISKLGFLSTVIYVVHLAVIDLYVMFLQPGVHNYLGIAEEWCRPLFIVVLSFLVAVFCACLKALLQKSRKASTI